MTVLMGRHVARNDRVSGREARTVAINRAGDGTAPARINKGTGYPVPLGLLQVCRGQAQNIGVGPGRSSTASAAIVILVAPVDVEKTQPWTETISFRASPERLSVLKLVKVVAAVVSTVRLKGAQEGGALADAGGTKKNGRVLRVKFIWPVAGSAPTEPVIWLGSRVMLLVVNVAGPEPNQVLPLDEPAAGVTDP
jgi:hypothetical protein